MRNPTLRAVHRDRPSGACGPRSRALVRADLHVPAGPDAGEDKDDEEDGHDSADQAEPGQFVDCRQDEVIHWEEGRLRAAVSVERAHIELAAAIRQTLTVSPLPTGLPSSSRRGGIAGAALHIGDLADSRGRNRGDDGGSLATTDAMWDSLELCVRLNMALEHQEHEPGHRTAAERRQRRAGPDAAGCRKVGENEPEGAECRHKRGEHGRAEKRDARHPGVIKPASAWPPVPISAWPSVPPKKWPMAALMIVNSSPVARQIV